MKQLKKVMFSLLVIIMLLCTFIIKTEVKAQTSTEPQLTVYKNNVSYKDSVYFMYAVSYENIDITQYDIQLLFWNTKQDTYTKGTEKYYKEVSRTQTVTGVDCVIYYSEGIAAKNIVDDIYTRAYVKIGDKEYYSEVNKTSVVDYLLRMIEGGTLNTNQKNLFNALLAYGAAAQNNFDYKTDQLATATYYNINVINGVTSDGFTYGRYKENTTITITANEKEGSKFIGWSNKNGIIISEDKKIQIKVTEDNIYIANYEDDVNFIIPEYKVTSEEAYGVTASNLKLPKTINVEYKDEIYNVPVSFDVSTFKEKQIGKQVLVGTITDNKILSETNIIIESVCLEVNVLPYTFEIDTTTQGYAIVKYYGNEEKVETPSVFNNKEVTTIRKNAFVGVSSIKELIISDNVTTIEQQAIYLCDNIEKITLSVINTYLGYYFGASSYSYNSTYIPMTLKEVILSNKVTSIGNYVFYNCTSLTNITIPNSVTSIGDYAFRGCTSLTNITIPNSVTSIGSSAFYICTSLESITIPNSVESIGDSAFEYCTSLTNITIPNSVTSIGSDAFWYCTSLENVYYNGTIEEWCNITFNNYYSNPMYYASHIYMLDSNNEYYEVTTIEIPNTITKISDYQFIGFENVTNVIIPNSVTSIGREAFSHCISLTNITIPNSVTSIERAAFLYCESLTNIIIPNSVTSIGGSAFSNCTSLTNITIPNSVISIGSSAFYNCESLTNITIPNSVTSIGGSAFYNCTSLTIICEAESQPSGWSSNWNSSKRPVYWDGGIYTVILDVDCEGIDNIEYECSFGTIELPTPTKEGYVFYGWYDESLTTPIYYKDTYDVSKDVVLKAMWAYTIELNLDGGEIVAPYKTLDELMKAFINDCNELLKTSYTVESSFTWDADLYKIFLDEQYKLKWAPLLQYFIDVETDFLNAGAPNPGKYPNAEFDLYEYWDDLVAGKDLYEIAKDTAPYVVAFAVQAWTKGIILETRYHYSGDFSDQAVREKVLDYYIASKDTTLYVPVGTEVELPKCIKELEGIEASIYGWQLSDQTLILNNEFIPTSNMTIKAIYGINVILDTNVDEEDPILEEDLETNIWVFDSDQTYILPVISRNNYDFLGWYDENDTKYQEISFTSGIKKLVAKWKAHPYYVNVVIEKEEGYGVTISTLDLPEFIEVEYKGNIYNIPVSFDTSTFVENQIGKQLLYGTITDNIILSETNIIIESVCLEINVLPYTFEIDTTTQGYAIVKYYGNEEKVETPNVFNNKEVTTIRKNAFYNLSCIKELVISDNVRKIEQQAIYLCDNIEKITLPVLDTYIGYYFGASSSSNNAMYLPLKFKEVVLSKKVTTIGYEAFYKCTSLENVYYNGTIEDWCKITFSNYYSNPMYYASHIYMLDSNNEYYEVKEIEIPNTITTIGDSQFYGFESVTNITIPNSVTSIAIYAFYNCTSLTSITIPNSVTSIGYDAFYNCTSLENVYYNGTIEDWCKITFSNYYSNPMYYASHIYMLDSNNEYYEVTTIEVPNTITKIGYQFTGFENVTSVTIPNSVTSIGNSAFKNCTSLTNITIPSSVTSIGSSAFYNCTSLTSITIPNSVTSIGSSAFENCTSLTSITIPNSVISIGTYAFYNCTSLTSITIPNSVRNIGTYAFYNCESLTNITIPDSVTSIATSAFENCTSLTDITIPNSVTSIGYDAFYNCTSLTNITIPNSVKSIGYSAFENCTSLTSIIIPNSVESIGSYAFRSCTSLTNITIPNSVTSISYFAFENCTSLTIYCEAISKPSGWHSSWNYSECAVIWGYTGNES